MGEARKGERPGGAFKRRRLCIRLAVLIALVSLGTYPFLETRWLRTVHLKLGRSPATLRIVHISDIHYKGDRGYLQRVVRRVNELQPDFVCFTGDLVEDASYQAACATDTCALWTESLCPRCAARLRTARVCETHGRLLHVRQAHPAPV